MIPVYTKPNATTPRGRRRKRPGARDGHPGHRRPTPTRIDRRQTHRLKVCPCCGGPLQRCRRTRTRLVEDLPEDLHSVVTEHTIHRDYCSKCKKHVEPVVPDALPNATFGHRIISFTSWCHYGLGVTLDQLVDILQYHLQTKLSAGGLIAACIHADPNQIEQVVMNLVVNARDAMPGGGTLTIETANVTLDEEDTADHPDVRPGPYVMFAISDTGCGIDKQTVQWIFEPFFTTKADGQGTGLGLATVHGIVKQTAGHVMVDSEPDRGTTFKVYFPAVDETASAKSRPHPADQTLDGNETVLICEDDDVVRDMVRHALESHGYTVLTAESAPHALKLAAAHSGPIHLLVTDVVMPEMNGRALAEALAVTRPEIKVLYVSGYTSDVIGHHGVLDEGVAFLQKPFNTSILLSCISSVLGRIGSEHHDS